MFQYCDIVIARTLDQLGAQIVDARAQRGWTQAELAAHAHVSRRWIIDLEAGRREGAELGRLMRVLTALDLGIELRPLEPATIDPAVEEHLRRLGVL